MPEQLQIFFKACTYLFTFPLENLISLALNHIFSFEAILSSCDFFFDNRKFFKEYNHDGIEEQTSMNLKNILQWKLVFGKSSRSCHEFISVQVAFLTLERIPVETESENPAPAHFCTFSSKYKHSTAFIYMARSSFYLCIFRKFNKIFAQKVFRTCEGLRCQVIQRTACKRGTGS